MKLLWTSMGQEKSSLLCEARGHIIYKGTLRRGNTSAHIKQNGTEVKVRSLEYTSFLGL